MACKPPYFPLSPCAVCAFPLGGRVSEPEIDDSEPNAHGGLVPICPGRIELLGHISPKPEQPLAKRAPRRPNSYLG